ncbi:flagellar hook-length control protein FliK [bacterium]|nr:flagellar hook-length control protein FliK [bacterium]
MLSRLLENRDFVQRNQTAKANLSPVGHPSPIGPFAFEQVMAAAVAPGAMKMMHSRPDPEVNPTAATKADSADISPTTSNKRSDQQSHPPGSKFVLTYDANLERLRMSVADAMGPKLGSSLFEHDGRMMTRRVRIVKPADDQNSNRVIAPPMEPLSNKSTDASILDVVDKSVVATSETPRTQVASINVDTLGQISIKPHFVDGQARLEIVVQSDGAREWLQNRLRALGLDLTNIKINVHGKGSKERPDSTQGTAQTKPVPSQALDRIQEIYQAARRRVVRVANNTQSESRHVNSEHNSLQPSSKVVKNAESLKHDFDVHASKQEQLEVNVDESLRDELQIKSLSDSDLSSKGESKSSAFINPPLTDANSSLNIVSGKTVSRVIVEPSRLPQMIQRIVDMANSQSSLNSGKLEVQLDIERLGNLLVDAVKHKDKINLQISVESNEVRRLIEAHVRTLVDQMVKEGIEIGKLQVSLKHSKDQEPDQNLARHDTNGFLDRRQRQTNHDWEFQEEQNSGTMTRDFGYNSLEVWA